MSDALLEPDQRVRARWYLTITLVNLGIYVAFFGPLQVLLATQSAALDEANKESILAWVTGFGAAVSMISNPLFGALSDRTTSRFGRRVPWIAVGAVAGAAALLFLAGATTVAMMIVGWCLVQAAANAMLAASTAVLPDLVPRSQRAEVGGWVSLGQTLGILVGVGLAISFGGFRAGYIACAIFLLLSVIPYVWRSLDKPLRAAEREPFVLGAFAKSFWISPRDYPDFAWAWGTRFLVNLGNAIATLYLLFYLGDEVGVKDPETKLFILIGVYSLVVAVTAVLAGGWSDRIGKRKIFVVISGIVIAVATVILAFWPTWTAALVAAVILGIGFGAFLAVDLAIVTEVLPHAGGRAKDLGIINIANAMPQVMAPAIAAPIVTGAGGYPALYLIAAVIGLIGAVFVVRIKSIP